MFDFGVKYPFKSHAGKEKNLCKLEVVVNSTNLRLKTTEESMHTDVFYHLFWQSTNSE